MGSSDMAKEGNKHIKGRSLDKKLSLESWNTSTLCTVL